LLKSPQEINQGKNAMLRPRKIGKILFDTGIITKEQLDINLKERHRKTGEVMVDNGILTREQVNNALAIQQKERIRFRRSMAFLLSAFALSLALLVHNVNKQKGIVIQEAKIVTGVDKEMAPLKVTNLFPKNTAKVCAWISWANAKINSQLLVKWYFVTDDTPIYDYSLNIPKRDGIANVVLAMPEGKTLPSGLYKVTILLGKKQLTRPLTFEVQ